MNTTCLFLATTFVFLLSLPGTARTPPVTEAAPATGVVVFAKIILPVKAPADADHAVESWIAGQLGNHGATELRAVTGWVRIVQGGDKSTAVWRATLDGKLHGCPVHGRVAPDDAGETLTVDLTGWTPVGAQVEGAVVPAEAGSRRIATVRVRQNDEKPHAYVALLVGPPVR